MAFRTVVVAASALLLALVHCEAKSTKLRDGVTYHAHNHTCTNPDVKYDFHFRGANLGGWLVLEPWITPSLFYQFLGASEKWGKIAPLKVGMDSYTFCSALGPEEANKQLRRHWDAWVRDEDIKKLSKTGIDTVRIPVGDWMWVPYGPYPGCMDGAVDQLKRGLRLIEKYGLKAVIDIHTMKDSQNGFDNGGRAMDVVWTSTSATNPAGVATFLHWPVRAAHWIGTFNRANNSYTDINYDNIEHSLQVIQGIVDMFKDDPVVVGMQAVNEPWDFTPLDVLKQFYWDAYIIVRKDAPHWLMMLHDSFHFSASKWGGFLKNCPSFAFDTHIYQAWLDPTDEDGYFENACDQKKAILEMEEAVGPVIVGEYSLATDNCALWLNGFNDNLPGYPKVQCEFIDCPAPYMGPKQPGAPPDKSKPAQDPFGGGVSFVVYGKCPRGQPWENEQQFMEQLTRTKLHAFDSGHGWFFWNFRTEFEPRWDFMLAHDMGYFPADLSQIGGDPSVTGACGLDGGSPPIEQAMQVYGWTPATAFGIIFVAAASVLFGVWMSSRRRHGYSSINDAVSVQMMPTSASHQQTQLH